MRHKILQRLQGAVIGKEKGAVALKSCAAAFFVHKSASELAKGGDGCKKANENHSY